MVLKKRKAYYSIGEVAELLAVKQHVIRYWETEFSQLRPRKDKNRNRQFTENQIKLLQEIKAMLYDQRFTIEGAKKQLKSGKKIDQEKRSEAKLTQVETNLVKQFLNDISKIKNTIVNEMLK